MFTTSTRRQRPPHHIREGLRCLYAQRSEAVLPGGTNGIMSQHTNFLPIQYRRHQGLWFVLLLLGVGTAASDATEPAASRPYWMGRIEQDTTWHDTVYVGGDVTIAAAATLTLAPNTKVLFLPYRDETRGGLDSTRAELMPDWDRSQGSILCLLLWVSVSADVSAGFG